MNRKTVAAFGVTGLLAITGITGAARAASERVAPAALAEPVAWEALIPGELPSGMQSRDEEQREREEEKREREQEKREREQEKREREQEKAERENELYDDGTEAMDDGHWERAAELFGQVAKTKSSRTDAALYWKAYAENKLGRRPEALATIAELKRAYPKSRWLDDAKALEVEVRQATGQTVNPEGESDEDLKLLALNGLQQTDPEHATPLLEKFLNGRGSPRLKQRALFVLAQSGSPQAREVIARIARGQSNPDLQRKAVEYLGLFGGADGQRALGEIYASSSDVELKRVILRSFMISGDRGRLLAAAKGEKQPELRKEAIRQLGVLGARNELWQLYQTESSVENKEQILQALFVAGDADRLIDLAHSEKNPELRLRAIHNLGLIGGGHGGAALATLYTGAKDRDASKAVIEALFVQGNASALVALARKETDPELKKNIIQKLSLLHSKEATDYLMELLNK